MPLLRGRARAQARTALAALSVRHRRLRPVEGASLWSGLAGVALAQMELERQVPGVGHRALAEEALEGAVAQVTRAPLALGLSGIAGIGWVVGQLVGGEGDDDPCAAFDAHLLRVLRRRQWEGPFDLVDGLVGVGVYALDRLPRPSGRRMLADVVRHLGATARRRRPGLAWWSNPRWSGVAPPTPWNLGLAHGVPGVIALLGRVVAADIDESTRTRARALLDRAVAWLLAQELPARGRAKGDGCFAIVAGRGAPTTAAGVRWCYGDAGIAAALFQAARGTREPDYARAALRIALRAAARSESTAHVDEAPLCHGAAGVAHIFHRLHKWSGDDRLADASRTWFARTLAMQGDAGWTSDPGFLAGEGGIALALAAATSEHEREREPEWDRGLLLND